MGGETEDEVTSCITACAQGHLDLVKQLISNKADPSSKRGNDFTCLHAAAMNGKNEVLEYLLSRPEITTVNVSTTPQKYAPLHSASFGGHKECCKLLLTHQASLTMKNYRDETPEQTAARQNQSHIVQLLREWPALV